ncbi:DUF4142 domain-containing protein [Arundinibacter roseus]|uniref:DUF4142 domain-containing protein n=1 Tax=Arundinibacter roseus TaxID=2070510 RepID=A0A4R4KM75_9BACT|nr:DUF4142 domain-containing protein [Arundinibacter roseus]TDB68092.1 DUF4142 domain-containing protein [Arundinibacter roseus]
MKKIACNVLLMATLLSAAACNQSNDSSTDQAEEQNEAIYDGADTEDDMEFAVAAADGGMFEVRLGQLAQKNGASSQIKEFGKMMEKDHTTANEELKALAEQKSITLPTTLSDEKQRKYDDLAGKTGADFDKAYADMLVKAHKDDIDKFQEQANEGKDPDIKSWATGKVPTLQAHLTQAEQLQDAVK